MSRKWRWFYPGYLWTIIMTMAGVLIAHFIYKSKSWKWYDGVLTCVAGMGPNGTLIWGQPNAQTLGWVQIYDTEVNREEADLRVHENVHVVQAFAGSIVGVLGGITLSLCLGWSIWLGGLFGGFAGGLGFALLYAILFVYLYIKQGGGDWVTAYRANPFEDQAYTLQDIYYKDQTRKPWGA